MVPDGAWNEAGDGKQVPAEQKRGKRQRGHVRPAEGLSLCKIPCVMNHLERQTDRHFPSHVKEGKKDFKRQSSSSIKTTVSELEASPPAAFPPCWGRRPQARAEPAVPRPPRCRPRTVRPVQIPTPGCREGAHSFAAPPRRHRILQRPPPTRVRL